MFEAGINPRVWKCGSRARHNAALLRFPLPIMRLSGVWGVGCVRGHCLWKTRDPSGWSRPDAMACYGTAEAVPL